MPATSETLPALDQRLAERMLAIPAPRNVHCGLGGPDHGRRNRSHYQDCEGDHGGPTFARPDTNGLRFYDQHSAEIADPGVVSAVQDSPKTISAIRPATGATINMGNLFRGANLAGSRPLASVLAVVER